MNTLSTSDRRALREAANELTDKAAQLYQENTTSNKWDHGTDVYRKQHNTCHRLADRLRKIAERQ